MYETFFFFFFYNITSFLSAIHNSCLKCHLVGLIHEFLHVPVESSLALYESLYDSYLDGNSAKVDQDEFTRRT